jgi:hypothetical protein
MARIRSIKPETFTSETVSSLSLAARWTFVGLWTHVDDEGRVRDNAKIIRGALWPNEDETVSSKDVEGHLGELEDAEMICRYIANGVRYLHVVNFLKHQSINRPTPSKLPPCPHPQHPDPSRRPHEDSPHGSPGANEPSLNTHGGFSEDERRTERTATGAHITRNRLTEDSVSSHGALKPRARAREGEQGTGNREQGSAAPAALFDPPLADVVDIATGKPPQHIEDAKPETEGQRVYRLAHTYTDRVKLSNYNAVAGVVKKAVLSTDDDGLPLYTDRQIEDGLSSLRESGWSVTGNTLRIAIEGLPRQRGKSTGAYRDDPNRDYSLAGWLATRSGA